MINFFRGFMSCYHQNIYRSTVSDVFTEVLVSVKKQEFLRNPSILDEVDVIEVLEGAVRYVNTMESQLRNSSTLR